MHRFYYEGLRPNFDTSLPLEWGYGTPKNVPAKEVVASDKRVVRKRAIALTTSLLIESAVLYGGAWVAAEVWQHIGQEKAKGQIHDGTRTEAEGIPPIDNPLSNPTSIAIAGSVALTLSLAGGAYAYKQETIDTQIRRMSGVAKVTD